MRNLFRDYDLTGRFFRELISGDSGRCRPAGLASSRQGVLKAASVSRCRASRATSDVQSWPTCR